MNKRKIFPLALAVAAIVFLGAGCVKNKPAPAGNSTAAETAAPNEVVISNFAFKPPVITIKAGEPVIWSHDDNMAHTVVSAGTFQSPPLARGGKFGFTFTQPGEYPYFCDIHPSMKGKVIVK